MSIWDWVPDFFSNEPATYFVAEQHTAEFLEEAHLEPNFEDDDTSHRLVLKFQEPIRDGNEIRYLNLRNEEGAIINSVELLAGSQSYAFTFNPDLFDVDVIFVDNDGVAQYTDELTITEEVME